MIETLLLSHESFRPSLGSSCNLIYLRSSQTDPKKSDPITDLQIGTYKEFTSSNRHKWLSYGLHRKSSSKWKSRGEVSRHNPLTKLSVILDKDGMLRIGSHRSSAVILWNQKHPIIPQKIILLNCWCSIIMNRLPSRVGTSPKGLLGLLDCGS